MDLSFQVMDDSSGVRPSCIQGFCARPAGDAPDDSLADLMPSYTPKQRETVLKGFRILAEVAFRAHMRRQESASDDAPDGREEDGRPLPVQDRHMEADG